MTAALATSLQRRERGWPAFLAALAVLVYAAWLYWPGMAGPALLDDRSSLGVLDALEERPELAMDFVFGDRSGPLGRTVSMASFVLEKRFLDAGIAGQKRTNILLHLANGALVMWLFLLLLRRQGIAAAAWPAVALGAVWLLHPLLVSSVLYTVQRMAMLATSFMLLTLITYLYWRAAPQRWLRLLPVGLCFALGMLSKENTVVVLPILLLMEALWLRFEGPDGRPIHWLRQTTLGLIVLGSVAAALLLWLSLDYLAMRHEKRPFSLEERVLTQPRILWDYVLQWFAPDISRMGIYHDDYAWSRGWADPPTTRPALLAWVGLLAAGVAALRYPVGRCLAFCVAWFLIGHAVESTVWPLELYFEHRNYFPAIGLVLIVGVAFAVAVRRWREVAAPLCVCLGLWALVLSLATSLLVQSWSSMPLLVLHHLNGHPGSARANTDMAVQMMRLGSTEGALRYSGLAYEASHVELEGDWAVRDLALLCRGNEPVSRADIDRIGETGSNRPLSSVTTLLTLVRLLQDNACPGFDRTYFADKMAWMYLDSPDRASASKNMYANMATLENALGRYDRAHAYVDRLLTRAPEHRRGLLMKLHFATALGRADSAREAVEALQALDQQGKLTLKEQQTLALYLDE